MDLDLGTSHVHHSPVLVADSVDLSVYLTNFKLLLDIFKEAGWLNSGLDFVLVNKISGPDLVPYVCKVGPFPSWLDLFHLVR